MLLQYQVNVFPYLKSNPDIEKEFHNEIKASAKKLFIKQADEYMSFMQTLNLMYGRK